MAGGWDIIDLTREPLARYALAAGRVVAKSSALSYQDRGATFYVSQEQERHTT